MVNNRVGAVVRGPDFFGREEFMKLVSDSLKRNHILLAAPRRFGKTSVMYRLMDQPAWDYQAIHLDAEDLETPADFVAHLVEAAARKEGVRGLIDGMSDRANHMIKVLRDNLDEVSIAKAKVKLRQDLKDEWQHQGRELCRRLANAGEPVVIFLDELPMMIERMKGSESGKEEAKMLLRWLRAIRQRPEMSGLRFILAGSIGIEKVVNEIGELASINDFYRIELPPFTHGIADRFLCELAQTHQLDLPEESRTAMIQVVGVPVPYFLQVLFAEALKSCQIEGLSPSPDHVERVYNERLLAVGCKTYFDYYYSRFRLYYPLHLERAAKCILRELAPLPEGMTRDACYQFYHQEAGQHTDQDEFHGLMADLEYEFYLRFDGNARRYVFACKLLKDWWLRHYT